MNNKPSLDYLSEQYQQLTGIFHSVLTISEKTKVVIDDMIREEGSFERDKQDQADISKIRSAIKW